MYKNQNRLRSAVGKGAFRRRAERAESSVLHPLDRGSIRRPCLRVRVNGHRRCLDYVADFNFGLILSTLIGAGTPKELAAQGVVVFRSVDPVISTTVILFLPPSWPEIPGSATGVGFEYHQT